MTARATRVEPSAPLRGRIAAPPDKSISHRAALLGAMSSDPVTISNYLRAADTLSTLDAIRSLGAIVEEHTGDAALGGAELVVRGTGLRQALAAEAPIDVGNAGTLMRLLPGWLAAQEGRTYTIDGDDSIRRRPVDRIAAPLGLMGATVRPTGGRFAPFTVEGAHLRCIDYELPHASAQVKSCILLAALAADGVTIVREPAPSRDHTERLLAAAGVPVQRQDGAVAVGNVDELVVEDRVEVPGDPSSAAFAVAAACLVPGSRAVIEHVGVNWTRTGFLRVLERMGAIVVADLEPVGTSSASTEPVSDLDVAHGPLLGTVVQGDEIPLCIDELPLLALLGCFADGDTVVRGAGELRVKESDRISTVVEGLRALGGDVEALEDGFAVRGTGKLRGGVIDAHGDHRLALLGAVAGMASEEGVEVVGMEAAAVSYPAFLADMQTLARA